VGSVGDSVKSKLYRLVLLVYIVSPSLESLRIGQEGSRILDDTIPARIGFWTLLLGSERP
jgi:hypothetical protein